MLHQLWLNTSETRLVDRQYSTPPISLPPVVDRTPFGDYTAHRLSNGLRLHVAHIPSAREVHIGAVVGTGSRAETASERGAAHLLEHCVLLGHPECPTERDYITLQRSAGIAANACTTHTTTRYLLSGPPQSAPKMIDLLRKVLFTPSFTEDQVREQQQIVYREINERRSHGSSLELALDASDSAMLGPSIPGSVAEVARLSGESLRRFHSQHYHPQNIDFVAVGAIDPSLEGRLNALGEIQQAPLPAADLLPTDPAKIYHPPIFIHRPLSETQDPLMVLRFCGPQESHPGFWAWRVLNAALSVPPGGIIQRELRYDLALTYGVRAIESRQREGFVLNVAFSTARESLSTAANAVANILKTVAQNGLPEEDFRAAREVYLQPSVFDLGVRDTVMGTLADFGRVILPHQIAQYGSAVTPDQVRVAAQHMLQMPSLVVVGDTDQPISLDGFLR